MTSAQDKRKKASGGVKTNWTRFCLKMLQHVTQHKTDGVPLFLLFLSDIFLIINHDDTWYMSSGRDCSPN